MKIIILVIIANIIYELGKKGIKILLIKWNKKKLNMIINQVVDNKNLNNFIDKDFWEDKSKWI